MTLAGCPTTHVVPSDVVGDLSVVFDEHGPPLTKRRLIRHARRLVKPSPSQGPMPLPSASLTLPATVLPPGESLRTCFTEVSDLFTVTMNRAHWSPGLVSSSLASYSTSVSRLRPICSVWVDTLCLFSHSTMDRHFLC